MANVWKRESDKNAHENSLSLEKRFKLSVSIHYSITGMVVPFMAFVRRLLWILCHILVFSALKMKLSFRFDVLRKS